MRPVKMSRPRFHRAFQTKKGGRLEISGVSLRQVLNEKFENATE